MSGYIGNIPVPQATQTRDVFTATAGQTSFATSGYTPGFLDVYLNGVKLIDGTDFTASNGSDVVLNTGAALDDTLEVIAFTTFEVNSQNFTGNTVIDNVDINGGTIDGVTIGGASAGAGTFTTLTATGNVTLGNAATDTVTITADVASNIIPSVDNTYDLGASGSEWKDLYIDGTANIDILVADTADINGGTIDGTVIGGSTPAAISGTTGTFSGVLRQNAALPFYLMMETDFTDNNTQFLQTEGQLRIRTVNDAVTSSTERFRIDHATGDISFYEDTGTTPKFFWDASAEALGIGTSSPAEKLEVYGTNPAVSIMSDSTSGRSDLFFKDADGAAGRLRYDHASNYLAVFTNGNESMRIDSSGNVGIGTSAPNVSLAVAGSIWSTLGSGGTIRLYESDATRANRIILGSDAEGAYIDSSYGSGGSADIVFRAVGSENMRITRFGNVLCGSDGGGDIGSSTKRFKDLYLSGGVYLGGTGAANLLDDYEEGTWNILEKNGQGGTMTTNRAHYTKIGRMVYASGSVTVGTTTNVNHLNLTLPFSSSINGYYIGGGNVSYSTLAATYRDNLRPNMENAADNLFFFYGNNQSILTCAQASNQRIDFFVIYQV